MTPSEPALALRISQFIGCPVRDAEGRRIGEVSDLRLRPHRPYGATVLRVESLIVDNRRAGRMFGYERHQQHGPWLLRTLIRSLHRHACLIDWGDLESVAIAGPEPEIRLRAGYRAASPIQ